MRVIFVILIFLTPVLLDLYIWASFKSVIFNRISYSLIYWSVTFLSIFSLALPFIISRDFISTPIFTIIYGLIFSVYISKLFILVPLFIDNILDFFKFLSRCFTNHNVNNQNSIDRLTFLQYTAVLIGATSLATFFYGIFYGRYNFKKYFINVPVSRINLTHDIKIVQISDLHLGSFHSQTRLSEVINIINQEQPDLVFFTGDLVNTFPDEATQYINILKKIQSKFGSFSVLGNHDYADYAGIDKDSLEGKKSWSDHLNKMRRIHKKIGFDLLMNENRVLKIYDSEVNIIGVENWGRGRFSKYGDFDQAKLGVNNQNLTILLSHDPTHWDVILQNSTHVDLQMSGHTHGMQFGLEIPGIKWSPAQWRYKHWGGLYHESDSFLYVNRGLGHLGYPGRVGILPEITICTIPRA